MLVKFLDNVSNYNVRLAGHDYSNDQLLCKCASTKLSLNIQETGRPRLNSLLNNLHVVGILK